MLVHSLLLLIALSCSCTEVPVSLEPPAAPSIHLNSVHLPNQTEIVLNAGSNFSLSCHGNSTTHWSSTAFLLVNKEELANPLGVNNSVPKHTGTYRCGYTRQGLDHLDNWIHLYIKDPAHSASVFVTPRKAPETIKEGEDFLFKCLLTDPSVKNLTLQTEGSIGGKGWGLPQGMNVTLDPRRGALIRNLQRSFSGRYVCSGWKNGTQFKSKSFNLFVAPRLPPPALSISQDEFVRLEGERFEVTCLTSNPSHHYYLTWTHPNIQTLNVTKSRNYINNRLHINGTLTISAVSLNHSGPYTCSAFSEDGVTTATTQLRVLDRPYLRTYLQLTQHANATTTTIEVEDLFANVSITSVKKEPDTNISFGWKGEDIAGSINISGSIRVEVYEGQDVTLTFVIEAYPPIRRQDWTTPTHTSSNNNTAYQESYTANGYRSEASLLLRRVRHEDQGRYLFHFSNSFFSRMQNIDVQIYRSPTAVVNLQNGTLTCTSSGYPLPTIRWYTCARLQDMCGDVSINHMSPMAVTSWEEEGEEEVRSHLPLSAGDDITVCVASNQLGDSRDVFSPWTSPSFAGEPQTLFTAPLIAALSTAAILLLLLLFVSHRWRQKPKYEIRWKIIESSDGNNYTFIDPAQLPYNQKWEFPRDKLCFGAVLGSGAFGKVVEATAYGLGTDDNITRVAVKMLKPSAHSEERDALMSELKILSHLGYHDNIVNLLGACTQGGPMLMITEYCSHGDLLNFLRAHAHDFMSSILSVDEVGEQIFYKNMGIQSSRLRSDSGISCCSEYQEMLPVLTSGQTLGGQTGSLSFSDLMRFSYQVAQGLDFLSTRNCIHRDVAARNILLTDRRVAKICDFGLARDIRNDDSYIVQGNARLPVKWMAPESIFQCVYTVQSDVWSYGVLLWEIFSLGNSPYPNIAVDTNFFKMIMDGCHMAQPDFAPAEMYELMTLCWNLEPTARPTFKTIGQLINRLLPSTSDTSTHHSHQLMYRNIDECREEEEEEEEKRKEKH